MRAREMWDRLVDTRQFSTIVLATVAGAIVLGVGATLATLMLRGYAFLAGHAGLLGLVYLVAFILCWIVVLLGWFAFGRKKSARGAQIRGYAFGTAETADEVIHRLTEERDRFRDSALSTDAQSLAKDYRSVNDLVRRLEAMATDMDTRRRKSTLQTAVDDWVHDTRENEKQFDEARPDFISLVTDLRVRRGLLLPALADDQIAGPVVGPIQIRRFIEGLLLFREEIARRLIAEVTKA